jgi:hypothetical protein
VRSLTIPIFLAGVGSAIEVYPVPYLYTIRRPFDGLTDGQLLASDWHRVGQALYSAMGSVCSEIADVEKEQARSTPAR